MSSSNQTAIAQSAARASSSTKRRVGWAGPQRIRCLFLDSDGIIKFVKPAPVMEACRAFRIGADPANGLRILLLLCTAVYLFPRTSVLGRSC